ncbi:uncharacterized protein TNCV_3998701 [Trichonephila clavipes]|nr:uncharacterized protein TNCV_3998701 [Trichonephila clavipes]
MFRSAWKGRFDLRFASARCLEIVCGTIATPTSARVVERVTVGSTSACRTILQSFFLVVFLVAPDPVFRTWVPSRVHCSQQFLTAHSEQSTWPATRRVDQPAVFIPMIRPLSNSLNCEKCLLARLPGMFRLPKSSYNWWVFGELHFSDDAIRRYTEAYNEKTGEKISVPLKRYRLHDFAVPTILTDFPTYLSNSGNPTRECPEKRLQRLENEHLQRSIQASIISKEEFEKKKSFTSFPELVECLNAEKLQDIWTVIYNGH